MIYQLSFVLFIIGHLTQANAATRYKFSGDSEQSYGSQFTSADSISTFSIDLLKALHRSAKFNENVVCSPVSVYSALALLLLGSSGTTSDELRQVMRLPTSSQLRNLDSVHSDIAKLLKRLQDENIRIGNKTISQVTFANAIFIDDHMELKKSYENAVNDLYKGYIKKLDFTNGFATIEHINNWIATKTNNQISQIFTEPLNQQSSIVEVSSVYFSGGWSERFPLHSTKKEDFNTGSRTVEVEMMNNKGKIPYQYNSNLEFESIQLDFHGRYYSAVFVLPHKRQTISNLIGLLDKSALREILSQTNYRGVNYKIPKMKFFSSRSLKEPLASRGLSKLFDKANLALMLDTSAHKISDVKHAVEIEVDELGAKATALTSVRIEPLAAKNPPENTVDFILDRPFIFMIQHRISGTILFTAIVREPSQ
ncbi:hypothetical protein V9T40_005784 [Parthenolecanium corni]|uniref:Serpin domain-containing protein n=1 Tax=Parthenolecanium corni TaxID=536013 RepID=A0AAN9U3X8_9HEMI